MEDGIVISSVGSSGKLIPPTEWKNLSENQLIDQKHLLLDTADAFYGKNNTMYKFFMEQQLQIEILLNLREINK